MSQRHKIDENLTIIEIEDLYFSWKGTTSPLLQIKKCHIKVGEKIFLKGPSGSGKSTLLSILTGILKPQQGSVNILGTDICQLNGTQKDRFRADNIGYIFQMFNLLPYLNLVENVILPCNFSKRRKRNLSAKSIKDEAIELLQGLGLSQEVCENTPVAELSVGQQQRVAAARALIGAPQIIIADEPTSALDTEHRQAFLQLLFDECDRTGSTLIFVSHDPHLATFFDRVIDLTELNRAHMEDVRI